MQYLVLKNMQRKGVKDFVRNAKISISWSVDHLVKVDKTSPCFHVELNKTAGLTGLTMGRDGICTRCPSHQQNRKGSPTWAVWALTSLFQGDCGWESIWVQIVQIMGPVAVFSEPPSSQVYLVPHIPWQWQIVSKNPPEFCLSLLCVSACKP